MTGQEFENKVIAWRDLNNAGKVGKIEDYFSDQIDSTVAETILNEEENHANWIITDYIKDEQPSRYRGILLEIFEEGAKKKFLEEE